MKQCKCEHWQQCPVCMPHRFDANGNLLPPEPTPLQACQAEVSEQSRLLGMSAERELRLRAINAQLLEALEGIGLTTKEARIEAMACAAIAAAKEGA